VVAKSSKTGKPAQYLPFFRFNATGRLLLFELDLLRAPRVKPSTNSPEITELLNFYNRAAQHADAKSLQAATPLLRCTQCTRDRPRHRLERLAVRC
jgi:hypothetical protein